MFMGSQQSLTKVEQQILLAQPLYKEAQTQNTYFKLQ